MNGAGLFAGLCGVSLHSAAMYSRTFLRFLLSLAFAFSTGVGITQQFVILPDRPDGVYAVGETARWQIEWDGDDAPTKASYAVRKGGLTELAQGDLSFHEGKAAVEHKFESPGTVLVNVTWKPNEGDRRQRVVGGAVAAPDQIKLSAPCPADFDTFWTDQVTELQAIPANPVLTKSESNKPSVDYWKITMDNIRGTRINGQLARPTTGDKFPALLIVQWAGVYGLQQGWVTDRAEEGWLALNIMPHDLPIDEPPEYYREQSRGELSNYWAIGNDDRDSSYFLRMYLSCYRAAEYLSGRDDWNGETLVVMGDSQGGQQTLMTAGFHPRITAALALVPAGADMLGPEAGRKGGWPQWFDQVGEKDAAKVHEASRYYDVANFASRITCPVLVGVGLLDETCPPEGILAAVNQIHSPLEVLILPESGHQNRNGSQKPFQERQYGAWLPALRDGKSAPVQ